MSIQACHTRAFYVQALLDAAVMDTNLAFCTFGMFIIDEIEYINGKGSEHSIIGGAGTYAAIGARLAAGSRNAQRVGWIVDQGSDFPPAFKALIDAWQTACLFRADPDRLTTRGWNGYGPNEYRAFKYLTPKLRLEESSLSDDQVLAKSFHMICSPIRCISLVKSILARRLKLKADSRRPVFVWEPVPDLCTPEELKTLQEAATHVDVVSPNGDELSSFFSSASAAMDREAMIAAIVPKQGDSSTVAVVVRDGADGSRLYLGTSRLHVRAYQQHGIGVIDPTGGGNTYLGALTIGLTGVVEPGPELMDRIGLSSPDSVELPRYLLAMVHATIAASFAIEQTGMPELSPEAVDVWNGTSYQERFLKYIDRERGHLLGQVVESCVSSRPAK